MRAPVAAARLMLFPFAQNGRRVEYAFAAKTRRIQQGRSPVLERPAQPSRQWHREPFLGPVHHMRRHMAVQQLAQQILALAVAPLVPPGQAPGKFAYALVDHGNTRLQAERPRPPVELKERK